MKTRFFSLLLLSFTWPIGLFAQQLSNDFLPLSIGNRWTYNYSTSDWGFEDFSVSDSGTAVYTITSMTFTNDSTIWAFKEVRSIMHRDSYYFQHNLDTSYAVNDSNTFTIIESHSGRHKVLSSGSTWQSVFYLNSILTDSLAFFRYFPSESLDSFTVNYEKYYEAHLGQVLSITYQRSLGLIKVAYSAPGLVGAAPKSNHTLKAAFLTPVEDDKHQTIPDRFILNQNFPNPFNPITTISFQSPNEARVTIRIYDILGRLVTTLFDSNVQAGYHAISWTPATQSSGTYFCTASVNGQSQSIRILLAK